MQSVEPDDHIAHLGDQRVVAPSGNEQADTRWLPSELVHPSSVAEKMASGQGPDKLALRIETFPAARLVIRPCQVGWYGRIPRRYGVSGEILDGRASIVTAPLPAAGQAELTCRSPGGAWFTPDIPVGRRAQN